MTKTTMLTVMVVLSGCGDVVRSPNDEGPDAMAEADAAPPDEQPRCSPDTPFGVPVEVAEVNSVYSEWSGRPTDDELVLYFGSDRPSGDNQLYAASRSDTSTPFGPAVAIDALNVAGAADSGLTVTGDGLTAYFHSDRAGGLGWYDIYTATRSSVTATFPVPTLVARVSSTGGELFPYVSRDGTRLYFASDRDGSLDLFRSEITAAGELGVPEPIAAVNTAGDENTPIVSDDELQIYFERGADIWMARRSTTRDGFGEATLVGEVSSEGLDLPMWISPDGCSFYLLSTGRDGTGGLDVFVARREPVTAP